ncbi:Protein kinase [Melia azedarach]|uniref:Protein kinase n=1 Tax=Melia azedarach TaxID=155640 RepID=A0ACC1X4Z5_MELAZ|nr:Protein kinase [Melia azedarach]
MLQQEIFFLTSTFMLCIFVGLLFQEVVSQIPLGSKLSVVGNDLWLSSNGDFALGFFNRSDQPNQFSVGIRFNSRSIPVDKRKVVWVAGADAAVGNRSYFQLTQDGRLLLFDASKGVTVWTTKTSQSSVASAILRDDGNLVLLNDKKDIVWQSFDTPSDTLLPGQKLSAYKTLRAASTDPVSSYYSLYMNDLGQLQLKWETSVNYWNIGRPSHLNLSAVLTSNGTLQLVDQNLEPILSVFGEDHDESVNFRFLRLDADGNLRMYSWLEVSQSWRSVWQAVENQCNVFATCGESGVCVFDASGSPACKCPFKYTSASNSKCVLPYPQECKSGYTWVAFEHMSLYGMYPANDSISQSSLQQCKDICLHDPRCRAVTFTNNRTAECRMIVTGYVSGFSDPSVSSVSFVKKCTFPDPIAADPSFRMNSLPVSPVKQSYGLCIPCLIGAASGTFVVFIVIQMGIGFWLYRKRKSIRRDAALAFTGPKLKGLIMLSFCEIKELSENFKYQMGPKMFRGMLPDNQPVAIKELNATVEARKFRSAMSKIGNIHHKNLLKLEGFCCEFSHRYLVYEFARNGSLDKYIEDPKLCKKLTWKKRADICSSVARALCYLHTECREFVSHGNLRSKHVVLDENYEAKVTEFGLGIFHGEALVYGTSAAKDVEDFGKIVLILVSGCLEVEDISEWAYNEWMEGRPETIVDKRLDGRVDPKELERVLRIAFWCLQIDERMRPSMGEVLNVLEGTLTVDPPPSPFTCPNPVEEEESAESGLDSYSPTEH